MSFRELTMIEVREMVRRVQAQHAVRKIARETGLDRKTVRRYEQALKQLGVKPADEVDDALLHAIASRVQARPTCEPSLERAAIAEHADLISTWLEQKPPLRLSRRATRRCDATRRTFSAGGGGRRRFASSTRRPARRRRSTSARWGWSSTRSKVACASCTCWS